ncbi:hypothetical protein P3T76_008929 [Phytophthora citrophthora]|uniref:Uncharacterized protein n=1 Tax=Phytophthora citrophthora TaxID=4793 RepID=A0AAD9GI59_9STRA|nr:hypothetical protein P3T76_008929 [Phytophthora citrophthora]
MPLKWFRSNRRNSNEDEATRLSTETVTTKQKSKRIKALSQRSRRSHSHGSNLRAMIGLDGSMQHELDAATAVAEEEQRRISYQTKTRRRFTIHALTSYHKHNEEEVWSCNSTPVGSPVPMYASASPSHSHSRRMPHTRSPHTFPLTPDSHPSIIFIDCPP